MNMQFMNRQRRFKATAWRDLIAGTVRTVLDTEAVGQTWQQNLEPQVGVTLIGPRLMRQINRDTRQVDRLTDVLSFPMLDMKNGRLRRPLTAADLSDPFSARPGLFLGDILISLDRAQKQAENYGHSMEREVAFLAIHGLLHLFGYDHEKPADEALMLSRQQDILAILGLDRSYV